MVAFHQDQIVVGRQSPDRRGQVGRVDRDLVGRSLDHRDLESLPAQFRNHRFDEGRSPRSAPAAHTKGGKIRQLHSVTGFQGMDRGRTEFKSRIRQRHLEIPPG